MNVCIYCRSELPAKVPREHVVPQSFGVFTPDLTLDCVCSVCNGYFGSKLEWPMLNQSIEGALRLDFGLKGVVGGVGTKGVTPTVAEGDDWKGARTAIRTNKDGKRETELLPQVGARRDASEPFQWCLERDLSVEFGRQFPKGSEFRIVGGRTFADVERLVQKLVAVCPTFLYGGTMKPPLYDDGGQIMLEVEYQMSRVVARCLCKIAFNYMALTCGETFAISREFNDMREFIRNDVGAETGRVFVKQKPIIAQEIITGQRGTEGHVLTLEGRPSDRTLEVQLALFNSVPYKIPITREYIGHHYVRGHHFDLETREVTELEVKIAGPDFDPSKITW
jgi:hypothetical protein